MLFNELLKLETPYVNVFHDSVHYNKIGGFVRD